MSRDFVTQVLHRALHEELFRQMLQFDAEAAADAMEMTYDDDDLRTLEAITFAIEDLDSDAAREYLQGLTQQAQDVFGGPQRPDGRFPSS